MDVPFNLHLCCKSSRELVESTVFFLATAEREVGRDKGTAGCDVLNGFQNRMQKITSDLINSCKKTCYSIGGRHDRSVQYIP